MHKWYTEICAWAEGKIIQSAFRCKDWDEDLNPQWDDPNFSFRIKPDSIHEPIRAWANVYKDYTVFHDTAQSANSNITQDGHTLPLIEAGYCQLIKHDGSNICPVDQKVLVIVEYNPGIYEIWKAGDIQKRYWKIIKYYAVILPTGGN